jgi:predicted AAA+ superfamily ATPase
MNEIANIKYDTKVVCNFEFGSISTTQSKNTYNEIFESTLNPTELLTLLEIKSGVKINDKTLIILDEIQYCKKALTAMKYFYEQMPNISIIAAGSLLGDIFCGNEDYSYPIGKITEICVYPLSFSEFLSTCNAPLLKKLKE